MSDGKSILTISILPKEKKKSIISLTAGVARGTNGILILSPEPSLSPLPPPPEATSPERLERHEQTGRWIFAPSFFFCSQGCKIACLLCFQNLDPHVRGSETKCFLLPGHWEQSSSPAAGPNLNPQVSW